MISVEYPCSITLELCSCGHELSLSAAIAAIPAYIVDPSGWNGPDPAVLNPKSMEIPMTPILIVITSHPVKGATGQHPKFATALGEAIVGLVRS